MTGFTMFHELWPRTKPRPSRYKTRSGSPQDVESCEAQFEMRKANKEADDRAQHGPVKHWKRNASGELVRVE